MASLPRVILVGGAPLSGKTCLAQALASRLEISHVSTDDLSTAIRAVTNAETHPALHYLDVDGRYRDYYATHTPERLLEDALRISERDTSVFSVRSQECSGDL